MKASELRIGNWIFIEDDTEGWWEDEVSDMDIGLIYNSNSGFKPIPLTEEWLEKFGFKQDGNDIFTIDFHDVYIAVGLDGSYGLYNSEFNWKVAGGGLISKGTPLKHVHQLQNLYFALTNTELKIK